MDVSVMVHVSGGAAGLLSGYAALWATKGQAGHRRAGLVFVVSMLVMGLTGSLIAATELAANPGVGLEITILAGLLTSYLVLSGWLALRTPTRREVAAVMGLGVAIVLSEASLGISAVLSPTGARDGMPAPGYFMFGSVAALGVIGDARVLRGGAVVGARRLRRHLWRMCTALLIAAMSFFLGQADNIPEAVRILPLQLLPLVVVLGAMVYWLWRLRTRRARRGLAIAGELS